MGLFDFITGDDFRRDLENDYKEINSCVEIKTWKAACVLAGSIIEAVLIDFLKAADYKDKDILKRSLGQILDICEKEGYLSEKAIGLSNAIRNYRNLIHPGRRERLQEEIGEDEAKIAQALIGIIIKEISSQKEKIYGYTAEQIISKVRGDPSSLSIIEHLLDEIQSNELRRLLDIIPEKYYEMEALPRGSETFAINLEKVFRLAFNKAKIAEKKRITKHFLKILTEEKEEYKVLTYEEVFFRPDDLDYLLSKEVKIVKKHLLARLDNKLSEDFLKRLSGIGKYIEMEEVPSFVNPLIKELVNTNLEKYADFVQKYIRYEYYKMKEDCQEQLKDEVNVWIKYLENKGKDYLAKKLYALKVWEEELPW